MMDFKIIQSVDVFWALADFFACGRLLACYGTLVHSLSVRYKKLRAVALSPCNRCL